MCNGRKQLVGMPADAQAYHSNSLCMHSAFHVEKGEQMIVTSFNDITTFVHASGRGCIWKVCMSLKADVWFLELNISVNC